MIERDVSDSVRKFILKEFHSGGKALWHYEAMDTDGYRPDILIVIEYQSPNRQWISHSVESKVDKGYLVVLDKRRTCSGVKQANDYLANYRWLANIKNTLVYISLANAISKDSGEFICRVAKTLEEACQLLEAGFDYVTDYGNSKIFRKRK